MEYLSLQFPYVGISTYNIGVGKNLSKQHRNRERETYNIGVGKNQSKQEREREREREMFSTEESDGWYGGIHLCHIEIANHFKKREMGIGIPRCRL